MEPEDVAEADKSRSFLDSSWIIRLLSLSYSANVLGSVAVCKIRTDGFQYLFLYVFFVHLNTGWALSCFREQNHQVWNQLGWTL